MADAALIPSDDHDTGMRAPSRQSTQDEKARGAGCDGDDAEASEILQYMYSFLATADFNAARHTCRSWFSASLHRTLLVQMLKQGGWWSSMLRIITPAGMAGLPGTSQERIMGKWISRECNLANPNGNAFTQVGETDFRRLPSGRRTSQLHGDISFTVSLCGRYLIATLDQLAYIYELNHVCQPGRSAWSMPLRRRQGMPLGFMRPVANIICPRRILCASMDTSSGRDSVAFLMEGRVGMVCGIAKDQSLTPRLSPFAIYAAGPSDSGSLPISRVNSPTTPDKPCICHERSPREPPLVDVGERSVYRNICTADDPPRSVAICPQREGTDNAQKLRLISSAAGLLSPLDDVMDSQNEHRTTVFGEERTGDAPLWSTGATRLDSRQAAFTRPREPRRPMCLRSRAFQDAHILLDSGGIRTVSARSADHYRAVPLSDGYHILFTDPRTGCLCLGTDAPIGSVTRLLRKVWFRPPGAALSAIPILYAAASDTRHGVRVVATFAAASPPNTRDAVPNKQVVVFFTVPPDLFHDLSHGNAGRPLTTEMLSDERTRRQSTSEPWQVEESYGEVDVFSDAFRDMPSCPLEIWGQTITIHEDLTEIALDSSPEMVVWAFSSSGWAKAWAVDSGRSEPLTMTAIQQDGGVRLVDKDGDGPMAHGEGSSVMEAPHVAGGVDPFDGTVGTNFVERRSAFERAGWYTRARGSDRMSGTASVDLIEGVNGIVRLDVQLR
ncbi:uncharacterized protein MAM_03419 [Metarhizium album ARSEF 1941]|uniref:F-box domain-containing protein n=1 Tax=Metarhizium album (strain ARSEF 1941) TaxID=1081103 RepID=A0A0B2WZU4_METAS|nr:uncharacterized protein MAM_03419 [Metarhizium album ARSEF 1941]KHN98957.1 hypothetical protein MAM_03419 [Metarhizium album ARSEF 1941]